MGKRGRVRGKEKRKGKHKTKDLKIIQVITPLENMVKSFVNDLFEYTKGNLEKTQNLLKGKIFE